MRLQKAGLNSIHWMFVLWSCWSGRPVTIR